MGLRTLLLIVLMLLVIGAAPVWPYSRTWGFSIAAVLAILLATALGLALVGAI